jgi:CRP-like cAMP-binding protein
MAKEKDTDELELLGHGEPFRDELCSMIENAPMFNSFSYDDVMVLSDYLRAYQAKKGVTIFREGGKGTYMCIVVSGRVDIFKDNPEQAVQKKVATVRAGKSMGEMSLLDDMPHSATAIAEEDTTLLMLTKMSFERLGQEHPVICNQLLMQLARLMSLRLRQTTGTLVDHLDQ